jgi:DNA-binding FadR family transcriptional regulator
MLLEIPLAGLAAVRAGEHDLDELRALLGQLDEAGSDPQRIRELDARLHHMIARIAGNRLAGAFTGWIVEVFQPRLAVVIEPAVVDSVIAAQHRELIVSLVQREPAAAERAMRAHLVYVRDLLSVIEHDGPFGRYSAL